MMLCKQRRQAVPSFSLQAAGRECVAFLFAVLPKLQINFWLCQEKDAIEKIGIDSED